MLRISQTTFELQTMEEKAWIHASSQSHEKDSKACDQVQVHMVQTVHLTVQTVHYCALTVHFANITGRM